MLDCPGKAWVFSKLGVKTGFYQIQVESEDREKTAFTTRNDQYEYKAMGKGLCSVPATFRTLMSSIFTEVKDGILVACLDDILIYSKEETKHMGHLRVVPNCQRENQLYVSVQKCMFMTDQTEFFGSVF